MRIKHIKAETLRAVLLTASLVLNFAGITTAAEGNSHQGTSITLTSYSAAYDLSEVQHGAVKFTASIRNEDTTTITIAHPSICFPAGYKPGEIKRFSASRGKSEILLKITKPDGAGVILRDGNMHGFDPGNIHFLTIPSGETATFDLGWFFQNARGRWERDDEAAGVFMSKGKYKIRVLFRNFFPKAAFYDDTDRESRFVAVWTGEIESGQITVEIK
jgi:hypothetical protein